MAFPSVVVAGLRSNALRYSGRCLAPKLGLQHSVSRSFSYGIQRPGLGPKPTPFGLSIPSRNYTKPASESSTNAAAASAPQPPTDASAATPPVDDAVPSEAAEAITEATASAANAVPTEEIASSVVDSAVNAIPAALQYGDLAAMGLASWTPAGIVQWSMELINVTTGLPWFWTLVAGSLFWRAALLPLSVAGLRNSARLLPLQPQITAAQAEMQRIRMTGDKLALQKHALKIRKMYKDAGVNMGITALTPFVQIPITFGLFFGVRKMCQLPVPQLMQSGLDILPDLTIPDPYIALPIALCVAVNAQISIGAAELNFRDRPEMGHIMNGLRFLTLAGVWVMSSFPSGLLVSLITTSVATTAQSLAFQYTPIRKALNIPIVPRELRGKLPSPMETVRFVTDFYKKKLEESTAQQARQAKLKRK
ncbi:hypothetical protein AX16_008725 [Volvariella volvacea WC 439]|nr:hypothetical protein AX16_008725 [Volvariella volvacea WC 439]